MKIHKTFRHNSFFAAWLSLVVIGLALLLPSSLLAATVEQVYNVAGTYTWTNTIGLTNIQVECWGGGGAGGAAYRTTATCGGAGGAGGDYAIRYNVPVTPYTGGAAGIYTFTIPAAAVGPAAGSAQGTFVSGSPVTFTGDSGVTCTAAGGAGGSSAYNANVLTGNTPGGNTANDTGDLAHTGGYGTGNGNNNGSGGGGAPSDLVNGNSPSAYNTSAAGTTGSDVAHNGGAGGGYKSGSGPGNNGGNPGGGGGAAKSSTTSGGYKGGNGGLGQLIITYSFVQHTVKADNTLNLNNALSWTNGVPFTTSVATWDNTVTAANTVSLGADMTFGGIQILNPGGPVTINAGNTMTVGTAALAIDLSAAAQNLTLNCGLAMNGPNTWDVASGLTNTLGGVVSGAQNIILNGLGTTIFSNTNTYTGSTTLNGGLLQLQSTNAIKIGGGVTVAAGATLDLYGNSQTLNLSSAIGGVVDSTVAGTPTLTLTGGNINGAISNTAGSLTIGCAGGSQVQLFGNNSYSGGTYINGTTLNAYNNNSFGTGPIYVDCTRLSLYNALVITNPITIGANNAGISRGLIESESAAPVTLSGPITINSGVPAGAGHFDAFAAGSSLNIQGVINSSVPVVQIVGAGLGGPITYSGGGTGYASLNVSGTAQVGANNGIATSATVTIGANTAGILDLNGFNQSLAGIANGGASAVITNSSVSTPMLTLTASSSYGGTIVDGSGQVSLTVNSTGTVTLSGANTYSGGTLISAGTLLVNNTTGSGTGLGAVIVNSGGMLGGTGTISGLVTNNSGGTLSAGTGGIGALTLSGNVVLNSGSTNTFFVNGSTPTNNVVALGGTVTYGGVLEIVPSGTFTNGQTFTLFSGAGATDLSNFGSIVINPLVSGTSFTFTNGVLTAVVAGPSGPASLTNSYSGGVLSLSWPAGQGWRLQQQTNALSTGLSTNWVYLTDASVSSTNITVDVTQPTVFYRLTYP